MGHLIEIVKGSFNSCRCIIVLNYDRARLVWRASPLAITGSDWPARLTRVS